MTRRAGRGRFVAVVGPDGVGKSTVARGLLEGWDGPTGYVHFRPPLSGSLPALPPTSAPGPLDKAPTGNVLLGWLRLARNLVLFWWGYLAVVRPAVRDGALVVADRWGYGYVGQPRALRFYGPDALARLAVRLLPRPDRVVNLHAPVDVVVARKDELTRAEVEAELLRWAALPLPRGVLVHCPAEQAPDRVVEQAAASSGLTDARRGAA